MIAKLLACALPALARGFLDGVDVCAMGMEGVRMPSPVSGKCYCEGDREGYCALRAETDTWSGEEWEERMGHCDHEGGDDPEGKCAYYCICSPMGAAMQCCKPGGEVGLVGEKVVAKSEESEGPTCGEVKQVYKEQGCCGNPSKPFMPPGRRLSKAFPRGARDEASIIKRIRGELSSVEARDGPAAARKLAAELEGVLARVK